MKIRQTTQVSAVMPMASPRATSAGRSPDQIVRKATPKTAASTTVTDGLGEISRTAEASAVGQIPMAELPSGLPKTASIPKSA